MKQSGGHDVEIEVPVFKEFANESKISIAPFYHGWKVKKSDMVIVYLPQGVYGVAESKSCTHEVDMEVQHSS